MTVCPLAIWKPVSNHGGPMTAQLGLVLHVQEGNNSLAGWFNNPASNASSTYWVSKSGLLEQYVDSDLCAWAQAGGNSTYQSVETEGYVAEPLTPAQIATLADLYIWGHDTYSWPNALANNAGERGFGWHGMGGQDWGGHTGCPGALRSAQRSEVLAHAFSTPAPPTPEEDMPLNDADKQWISKAINDALRQQFRPEGECYGRVMSADAEAIRRTPANLTNLPPQ